MAVSSLAAKLHRFRQATQPHAASWRSFPRDSTIQQRLHAPARLYSIPARTGKPGQSIAERCRQLLWMGGGYRVCSRRFVRITHRLIRVSALVIHAAILSLPQCNVRNQKLFLLSIVRYASGIFSSRALNEFQEPVQYQILHARLYRVVITACCSARSGRSHRFVQTTVSQHKPAE